MTRPDHPTTARRCADYATILGEELIRIRTTLRWSRKGLVTRGRLPFSARVLEKIENGTQHCSVSRLSTLCHALGVPAPNVVAAVERRVGLRPPTTVTLRLRVLANVDDPSLRPLQHWAAIQAVLDGDLITVPSLAVHRMSVACHLSSAALQDLLVAHHILHDTSCTMSTHPYRTIRTPDQLRPSPIPSLIGPGRLRTSQGWARRSSPHAPAPG